MVMNITELKQIIKDVVFSKLDHKNLDKDVEHFKNNVSSKIWVTSRTKQAPISAFDHRESCNIYLG